MNRVLLDITEHFAKQSHQLTIDTLDTCQRAGFGKKESVASLVGVLLLAAASGSVTCGTSPEHFLLACMKARENADKVYAEYEKRKKKRAPHRATK